MYSVNQKENGFTIVELLVAVSVFITTLIVILDVYSGVLAINTKTQAANRASEEIRNFMEALVKDVRVSRIHYNANDPTHHSLVWSGSVPCGTQYRQAGDFKLALSRKLDDGSIEQLCYYLSDINGNAPATMAVLTNNPDTYKYLSVIKQVDNTAFVSQLMNPTSDHFSVEFLRFYVYPLSNPYADIPSSSPPTKPDIEPFVTVLARFKVKLPSQNDVQSIEVPYQTSVSSDVYDIQ